MAILWVKSWPLVALTLILSHCVLSTRATFYWVLNDFDVINDTNETCHGFEIELDGIHKEDITYTFGAPLSRYGDPIKEDKVDSSGNVVGCYLRYRAQFDEVSKQFLQRTVALNSMQQQQGNGRYACDYKNSIGDEYEISGCERFGLGFLFGLNNPLRTTYRWLIENPDVPGELLPFPTNVTIPAPQWTLVPQPEGSTTEPVAPVAKAELAAEPNPVCSKYGEALWVKSSTIIDGIQNSDGYFKWETGTTVGADQLITNMWDEVQSALMQQIGTREEVSKMQQFLIKTLENNPPNIDISALMEKLQWENDALLELLNKLKYQLEVSPAREMIPTDPISQRTDFDASKTYSVAAPAYYSTDTNTWAQHVFGTDKRNNFYEPIYLQDTSNFPGQPYSAMGQLKPNEYVVSLPITADQCAIKMDFPCGNDEKAIRSWDDIIISMDGFEMNGRSVNDVFRSLSQMQSSGNLTTINLHLIELLNEKNKSEWLLMQALPTCDESGSYLPINNTMVTETYIIGDRRQAVTRRYEFFQYTGNYDPETHEALPINKTMPDSADFGSFVGAQMPTVKFNDPLTLFSGSLLPGVVGASYSQVLVSGGVPPYEVSYEFFSGDGIPEGLIIDTNFGMLVGTPAVFTAGRVSAFTLLVTDSLGELASSNITLEIVAPVTIDASMLPTGEKGIEYSAKLATLGGASPMNWFVEGALPLGIKFSYSSGMLSGKPEVSGSYPLLFKVADSFQQTSHLEITLKVVDPVTVGTLFLTRGVNGLFYSFTLSPIGGVYPLRWTVAGVLPPGIAFDPRTAVLSGSSSTVGSYPLTVTVTDALRSMSVKNLTLTFVDPLIVTTTSLPQAKLGVSYLFPVKASGGELPFTWSITNGTLPKGVDFDSKTGVLSGSPLMIGSFPITFVVSDTSEYTSQALLSKKTLTLVVVKPINFTTSVLPEAVQGTVFSVQLSATTLYPPLSWFAVGRLPSGVTLNSTNGMLSGTPSANGLYNVTFQVKDASQQTSEKTLALTVFAPLNITTSVLRPGIVGKDYETQIGVTGGKPPLTWYLNSTTPSGLAVNNSTGVLRGKLSVAGPFPLNFVVKDSLFQTARKTLFLNISHVLNMSNFSLPFGIQRKVYSATMRASGGKTPYTWSFNGFLPPGLSFNTESATLSGIPTANGSFYVDLSVKDIESQSVQNTFLLTIVSPVNISTASLPLGTFGLAYSAKLIASGGALPLTWSATGTLPPGVFFNTSTGELTGIPTGVGSFSLVFTVKDALQQSFSKPITLTLSYDVLKVATITLPVAIKGSYYSAMLNCTGGKGPYTWAISSGLLPSGLSLSKNSINGMTSIVGTPSTIVSNNITLKVTDSNKPAATATSDMLAIRVSSARM